MPKPATKPQRIYQLKITLKGSKPPIWRRIELADTVTLAQLHQMLLVTMGWVGSHLHQFTIGGISYGVPDLDDEWEVRDEQKVKLNQLLSAPKQALMYEYDFGDGWEHHVVLEKLLAPAPDTTYPRCTAGKRACPPEDCGGIWGYATFLEAITDANHPEHDELLEWVGGEFDPEQFAIEAVNRALQHVR